MDSYFWERSASLPRDLLERMSFSSLLEETGAGGGRELREENEEKEGFPNLILICYQFVPNLIPICSHCNPNLFPM